MFEHSFTDRRHYLTVTTDQHIKIKFDYYGDDADNATEYCMVNDEEFRASDEMFNGLFVQIGGKMFTISQVRDMADKEWPSFYHEVKQEEKEWQENVNYLSSPFKTGRI